MGNWYIKNTHRETINQKRNRFQISLISTDCTSWNFFFCFIRPRSRSCGSRVSNVGRDSVELVESSLRYMLNTHTVEWHKKLNFSRKNVAYRHLPIYHIVRYIAIHEKRDFDGWKMLINFIMEIFFIPLHLMMLWICLLCSVFYQHIQQCVTRQVWSNVSGNEFIERSKNHKKLSI